MTLAIFLLFCTILLNLLVIYLNKIALEVAMGFFKISKKTPGKQTPYVHYAESEPLPEGNTVVGLFQKENGTKIVLVKKGDTDGNETLYNPSIDDCGSGIMESDEEISQATKHFDDEIDAHEEEFAISREIFCSELIRDVAPHCSPKYNRFHDAEAMEPLIGSDFISNFQSWESCYNYKNMTIMGHPIDERGLVHFPNHPKRIRGLGTSSVLLVLLGKEDRFGSNWGLINKENHLQLILIDFGRCLSRLMYPNEQKTNAENTFNNPLDMVKAVFQQYATVNGKEPPLPEPFFLATHIRHEIFETIDSLYHMPCSSIAKRAEDNFKLFPLFRAAIAKDLRRGIEHLHSQFKDDPEYIAVNGVNESFKQAGLEMKLSDLDHITADRLLYFYTMIKPNVSAEKKEFFSRQIAQLFAPREPGDSMSLPPRAK